MRTIHKLFLAAWKIEENKSSLKTCQPNEPQTKRRSEMISICFVLCLFWDQKRIETKRSQYFYATLIRDRKSGQKNNIQYNFSFRCVEHISHLTFYSVMTFTYIFWFFVAFYLHRWARTIRCRQLFSSFVFILQNYHLTKKVAHFEDNNLLSLIDHVIKLTEINTNIHENEWDVQVCLPISLSHSLSLSAFFSF